MDTLFGVLLIGICLSVVVAMVIAVAREPHKDVTQYRVRTPYPVTPDISEASGETAEHKTEKPEGTA